MKVFSGAGGLITGFIGAVIEAWGQLLIGKLRVLLSLVGVAAAVAAMTFTIALGEVSVSAINAEIEKWTGRPGTVTINITPTGRGVSDSSASAGSADTADAPSSDAGADPASSTETASKVTAAMDSFVTRYDVESWATNYKVNGRFAFLEGPRSAEMTVVSLRYGLIHHTEVAQGRWFSGEDEDDLSPSMVVSQGFLEALGLSRLDAPVKVTAYAPAHVTYTIVGVLEPEDLSYCSETDQTGSGIPCTQPISAFVLNTPFEQWLPTGFARPTPTLEVWAGPEGVSEIKQLAKQAFDAQFGQGSTTMADNTSGSGEMTTGAFTTVVTAAGLFVMILGALGLVNISMVTVRQRIHEIGVRRSFGATSRRIFFSIMLESVVATVVAGIVGIGIAIVAMRMVPLEVILGIPVKTVPPFPMSAALIGLLAATGVGALAGIVPAVVAVRIRPIDAIRY